MKQNDPLKLIHEMQEEIAELQHQQTELKTRQDETLKAIRQLQRENAELKETVKKHSGWIKNLR